MSKSKNITDPGVTELEVLDKGRRELEAIEAKLRALETAATDARAEVETAAAFLASMTSEDGILRFTDSQIDDQAKLVRSAQRQSARASLDLTTYRAGDAKDIGERLRQNARERFLCEHRAARDRFFQELREYLALGEKMRALELLFPRLAREAGFNRPPIEIFTSADGSATIFDLYKRDVARMEPTILPESDEQRKYIERQMLVEGQMRNFRSEVQS